MPHNGLLQDEDGSTQRSLSNSQEGVEESIMQWKPIEIVVQTNILSVALLADGQHFVGGDNNGKIRRWQVKSGKEVGTPIDAGSAVRCLVASQDGKWIVAGTESGQVLVWDAKTHQKVNAFTYKKGVNSVDISSDSKKIAVASDDKVVDIWSLHDKKWLCGRMNSHFHTVKFSPDGLLFAVGVDSSFLSIFNSQNGDRLSTIQISAQSVSWAGDSKQLFALCSDGNIYCIDVYSSVALSKWPIHSTDGPRCIALSSNSTFIAASVNASVSFWDTSTHAQVGFVIHHPHSVNCMTISPGYDLVIAGDSIIALWVLRNDPSTPNNQKLAAAFQTPEIALRDAIAELRSQLASAKQKEDALSETIFSLCADLVNSQRTIRAHRQKYECETLYADGHVVDATSCLLDIIKSVNANEQSDAIITNWLSGFTNECVAALERTGDEASQVGKDEEALAAYAAALSLCPSRLDTFLIKWVSAMLLHGSASEILDGARKLKLSKLAVYRAICNALEGGGRITEAVECFHQMQSDFAQIADIGSEQVQWELDFQQRCAEGLEKLAGAALGSQDHDEAEKHYSAILSLDQPGRVHILTKRSHARAMMTLWEDALEDADEAIKLDPSDHRGYERRHAALHGARCYAEAVAAFDIMLSKLRQSSDARVRGLYSQYRDARPVIQRVFRTTVPHMPRVLIDTTMGHLCGRTQLAKMFEELPVFNELVSSMTREIDHKWIRSEVDEFCGYVMFSHKWGHDEPLFQKVKRVTVYELEASRENIKLQTFCSITRSLGYRWAWSDTCCIDKSDNVVLQESLVAMFPWYRRSSLTIIHLLGVSSLSEEPDDLRESIWNSRVWTYQEYVAAQRVLFYTEDWKPYLGLALGNHKESPIILKQMEMSQVSSEQVAVLQPGLDRVREKLYLASTRETTLLEDIAYSLLGILNAPIPVMYGEGTRAVGRLLEYVLTGSGDATILAWTGIANDYNSCLPVNLGVYETVVPPHVPHMETAELDRTVTELHSSILDYSLTIALYNELNKLPSPILSSSRLRLPCILSRVKDVDISGLDAQTYSATTDLFGDIEIKTTVDLTVMKGLYLAHPWIRPLLDQEFDRGSTRLDMTTQALRLIARLQQPFGALLFEQVSRTEYKRVAADSLIMVQFNEQVSLTDLISNICTIEVL